MRDDSCAWLMGFSVNLGSCGVDEAELWAAWHGLQMAWELVVLILQVKMDSVIVVS